MVRRGHTPCHPALPSLTDTPISSRHPSSVVALYIKTDITSLPSVRSASTKILQEFNDRHPSILVNNAGIGGGFGMLDCEVERVRKVLDVNLISHW